MDELEAEVERLKERNETLEAQIDQIKDKFDRQISDLEARVDFVKVETEREWKSKLNIVEIECRDQLQSMSADLDRMRSAFSGDAGGWVVKVTPNGKQIYENLETGETQEEMPEVLYVANLINKSEEAEANMEELHNLRKKIKDAETTKREADIYVNKAKAEVNQFRMKDRDWRNSAKAIQAAFAAAQVGFDAQFSVLDDKLSYFNRKLRNMERNTELIRDVKVAVANYQAQISAQENQIRTMGGRIQKLIVDLEDKTAKVERLSEGIEGEVERICRPIREKVSEFMSLVMKEKASRAQERRELADLWPSTHIMPTVLMRHRALSEGERQRRLDRTTRAEANRALALEIQANVLESKMWEINHDDYGRQFFKHLKTSQTLWERPAIMDYKPPPGRDELGNYVATDDMNGVQWILETDNRGEVYYRRSDTGEISLDQPESFLRVTPSKEPEMIVGEAASLVLGFIKEKLRLHDKYQAEAREHQEKVANAKKLNLPEPEPYYPPEDKFSQFKDLSVFVYDLECVEMLAGVYNDAKNKGKKKKGAEDANEGGDRPGSAVRTKRPGTSGGGGGAALAGQQLLTGPSILDVDIVNADDDRIRAIIKQHATSEDQLQKMLAATREHLTVSYPARLFCYH
jgi:hypothetical protein